jgi:acetyl esterase/lipase
VSLQRDFPRALSYVSGLFLALSAATVNADTWRPEGQLEQRAIWPNGAPDSRETSPLPESIEVSTNPSRWGNKPVTGIFNVSQPTMTVYPPKGTNSGVAVVVFPGGGYMKLAIDLEGTEACYWLTAKGVTCVLLKYRVPASGPHWDEKLKRHVVPKVFTALQDAQRTVGLIRYEASKRKIDPTKIGVLGFSAGAHLVAAISTNYPKRLYPEVDAADKVSCRPDFAIALFPGHMAVIGEGEEDLTKLNPEIVVTSKTPPTFLLHAEDDPVDPVEYSLLYYAALRKAKVPTEMHLYAEGGHAFALRRTALPITHWTELADTWLTTIGMLPKEHQ